MYARLSIVTLLAVLAGPELILAPSTAQQPRKIFISVDLEGITGVVQPAQLGPEGFEYQRAREWMTGEVNGEAGIAAAVPPHRADRSEVGFKLTLDAERAAFVPGLTRSDAHNVKGTFHDMTDITRLLQVLTSLELP